MLPAPMQVASGTVSIFNRRKRQGCASRHAGKQGAAGLD